MKRFNIRVYGVLINEQQQVLVCDELIRGQNYTKFPGGGLELGEGTRDCLKREFMEEMDLAIEVTDHLYTTDFYQPSAFNPDDQIISIYYLVKPLEEITAKLSTTPFDFNAEQLDRYRPENDIEAFRFIDWNDLTEECVTLPIDKVVIRLLKSSTHSL
ncbi:NUDIX domain-containing protein [Flavisolibacter tropicus]|uniref:NUDIX hydrolase n=1 Tax=Flavisolibacter tropicus TaxID=1492898 RepID=A0A172TSI5_9BACT|nr:NUDIX domain-containing protein [Flavisolibacter tropicus]ANE50045.1 NUDIX hydrolase [Flavisolibacter tropicus]